MTKYENAYSRNYPPKYFFITTLINVIPKFLDTLVIPAIDNRDTLKV